MQQPAENRLIGMSNNTAVGPRQTIAFAYDWKGRRVQKQVGALGVSTNTTAFVYDGWNPVASVAYSNPPPSVLANGDFESPVEPSDSVTFGVLPGGWSGTANAEALWDVPPPGPWSYYGVPRPAAWSGNQYADIGGYGPGSAISQTFTVWAAGQRRLFQRTG